MKKADLSCKTQPTIKRSHFAGGDLTPPLTKGDARPLWKPHDFVPASRGGVIIELSILQWPKGLQNSIVVPPHHSCQMGEQDIVASFHTHPNTGSDFLQEPGETDKRAVCDDPDLKGAAYVGEFVISQETIYLIMPTGQIREVDETQVVFAE